MGLVCGNIRGQAGGGFQPVVEVVTGPAVALLVEVIGVIADIVLAGLSKNEGTERFIFHR